MIRSTAAGRCGIVGNPTDGYGGSVIASTLAERAWVELTPSEAINLECETSRQVVRSPQDLGLTGDFVDIAKSVLTYFPESLSAPPFLLRAGTTVPMQAGLAGSTAMMIATVGAIVRLLGREMSPHAIAETARVIEFDILKCVCGFQDQYMAALGGLCYLDFREKEPTSTQAQVFATVENLEPLLGSLPLILANTGVQRHSGSVHKGLRERWIEGDREVVDGYIRIARIAREAKRALLEGDWQFLGTAMNENHAIQRDLGGSGDANERLIAAALASGALGAKLAGAGKGGTIIALHPEPEALGEQLIAAGAARILLVKPSAGLTVTGEL